jgi:hypothetical protein
MGIRAGATRRVGALINNTTKAENYLSSGSRGARKLYKRASAVPKGQPMLAGDEVQKRAVALRQRQLGARALTGASLLGGVGMMRNRNGSRGGFQGPRGSGRYA